MPKFFVPSKQIKDNIIEIIGMDVNHIANVLRLKEKDIIEICNVDSKENYSCNIKKIEDEKIECEVIEKTGNQSKEKIEIEIFQGLPKADKMELIIQKCTELGVSKITPVQMSRSIVKFDSKSETKKIQRWQKIAEAASKQCKRNSICMINSITNIKNICNTIKNYDILLVPYENEKEQSFKNTLKEIEKNVINNIKDSNLKIAIVIGPEGGFEEKEINELKQAGGKAVTLGERILRTETVAITMTSIIMYEFEDLDF